MLYKNKYNKVISTIILSLYASCHLSTALAVNGVELAQKALADQTARADQAARKARKFQKIQAKLVDQRNEEVQEIQTARNSAVQKAIRNIDNLVAIVQQNQKAQADDTATRVREAIDDLASLGDQRGHRFFVSPKLTQALVELEALAKLAALENQGDQAFTTAKEVRLAITDLAIEKEVENQKNQKYCVNQADLVELEALANQGNQDAQAAKAALEKLVAEANQGNQSEVDGEDLQALFAEQASEIIDNTEQEVHLEAQEVPKSQEAPVKQEETASQSEKDNQQRHEDQQNRPEVIKIQEKLQIAQAPIGAQTHTVQNIAAIQSSIMSNITDIRMNINQYDIRTSEDENKPVAAGSQTVAPYITPKSWDIWASGHMGNIKQDAAKATSTNSKTNFYGGTIGIDKIFANNSILGLALSYGQSNTEYQSKTSTGVAASEKWTSNYYQADIYAHHNFTDSLFVQLIGGIGTYGDRTTIGNMFDFSSQKSTFGYHGNATIGYSIFSGEDSNFVITPKLGVAYYHLNIPDSILDKNDSSTFTTLGRFAGIAGLKIKILNLNSNSNSNVKIIPEITAALKLRLGDDNLKGINANNIKLPIVKSTNSNDLSANALAAPKQLFTLGGAITVATNNNFSITINGSVDFAEKYLAMVGGISVKLSF